MDERLYWLGFSVFPGVGPGRFKKLLQRFGNAKAAWQAGTIDLASVIGPKIASALNDFRSGFSLSAYAKKLAAAGVDYLLLSDASYPSRLASVSNAPFVLYVKGSFDFTADSPSVGVVGTRRVSSYGVQVTTAFVRELVEGGCVVVSGLALGVDSVAHSVTLEAGGKTVAVLGCGVDCCSPSSNRILYERILASGGAIVSEIPLGMAPTKGSFPSRNRIIAGLSWGVLVTEGSSDSGALYTANDAFEQGRSVFAIPGPITSSLSAASYQLIRQGGMLVTSGAEVMRALGVGGKRREDRKISNRIKGDTAEEQQILDLLADENLHFDELVKRVGISSGVLGGILSVMELKGMIGDLGGGVWGIQSVMLV
jgi:DNA processing protein